MIGGGLRRRVALMAAFGVAALLSSGASAGELVPGGWLQPYRVPDAAPPPLSHPAANSGTSARPPHRAAVHRPAPVHREPVRQAPASDGSVRF